VGSSYLPSDILAAFLYAQLEARSKIQAKRQNIWDYYYCHLEKWAQTRAVRLPFIPVHCEQPYHMFYLLMPSIEERQALIVHLKERGIMSVFHYLPLHLSDMGRQFGSKEGDLPVTEKVSDCLVRLPFYNDLTQDDLRFIVDAVCAF
jgi:dTDP-4-amino-4,6-dideoxygalactose transaminase